MVTYNHEAYISQAIEGALRQQTEFPFEIVIGEDCSTDGTRKIVLDYREKYPDRIRIVTSGRNVGAQANTFRVSNACLGKYIAYCDGDDFWHHPSKLQRQVDYLERHPDVGLVHSDHNLYLDDESRTIEQFQKLSAKSSWTDENDTFSGILLDRYPIATCTVCVRNHLVRQAYEQEREIFEHQGTKMADLCLWLHISRYCRFAYIDEALATYRALAESAAHSRSRIGTLSFVESSERIRLYFAEKYDCPEKIRAAVKKSYYTLVLNKAYHANDRQLAQSAFDTLVDLDRHVPMRLRLYLLGGSSRLIKAAITPFAFLRIVLLRAQRMLYLFRYARKGAH